MKLIQQTVSIYFLLLVSIIVCAQQNDAILFTVGNKKVSAEEFLFMYNKANQPQNETERKASVDEYLELYINLKLKVLAAESEKMESTAKFKKEYESSKQQLIESYLTDKNISENLIREAYERLQEELNISHLLIEVEAGSTQDESDKALKKINLILKKIKDENKDFEEMAYRYSNDPSAKENRGNLGYISAFQTVYPFESAAYELTVGNVSKPVKTKFGYHLIWLKDKRKSQGEISVAHILLKTPDDAPEELKQLNKNKVDSIYQLIINKTMSWEKAVTDFSQDNGSNRRGGALPAFGAGKMVAAFEDAAFALKTDQAISKPVKTSLGWHIIKRLHLDTLGTLLLEQGKIRKKVEKDSRSDLPKKSFIERIKKENDFEEYLTARNELINQLDVKVLKSNFEIENYAQYGKNLFKINDQNFTQQDFLKYLKANPAVGSLKSIKNVIEQKYENFVNKVCTDIEISNLEIKYPAYKWQLQEYYDGLLFFEITEREVWNKSMNDEQGLKNYFKDKRENYMWEERIEAYIYKTKDLTIAKKIKKLAKREKINDAVLKEYDVEVINGTYNRNQNKYVNTVEWAKGVYGPSEWEDGYVVIWNKALIEPTQKTLLEAKGYITSDYQEFIEKNWVKSLREKYSIIINEKTVQSLYK